MVTLSLEYILFVVIASAAFAAVLLFLTGRWFEIEGYRYQLDAQRYAIDLLNLLVSNSPIVERYEEEEPQRLILNSYSLNSYQWIVGKDGYDSLNPPEWRKNWEKKFELLEFEYELLIEDLNGTKWIISNLYFNDSACYDATLRVSAKAEVPVVISYGKEKHPGKATLTLKRTPLSLMAFYVSEAMLRGEWKNEKYARGVIVDTSFIKGFDFQGNRVCQIIRENGKYICKYFYRGSKELSYQTGVGGVADLPPSKCPTLIVYYSPKEEKVIVNVTV